jgi:hypothetical protein
MKTFTGLSTVLVFSVVFSSYVAMGQEIPEITAEECPGLSITRNEYFDGRSLWGYMNGGADIYLEYGFVVMRVEVFSDEDEEIKLELFKMENSLAAYGIYSIKTFNCQQGKILTTYDCLNRFQFQLIHGDYYIQLINESGSEKAKQAMIGIAETLIKKIEPVELTFPVRYLTDYVEMSPLTIKMVKGMVGVQNKIMNLSESFEEVEGYQVYYANTLDDEGKARYYEVFFDEPAMKDRFLEVNKDKGLNILEEDETCLLMSQ